jgi:HrpA-like RNA helicase
MVDALTPCEDLTDLGQHLIDLPVEPRLGKALLFAIVLRCLDPVLTIICTLAYK